MDTYMYTCCPKNVFNMVTYVISNHAKNLFLIMI